MSPQIVFINRAKLRFSANPLPIITNGCLNPVNYIDFGFDNALEVTAGRKFGNIRGAPIFHQGLGAGTTNGTAMEERQYLQVKRNPPIVNIFLRRVASIFNK